MPIATTPYYQNYSSVPTYQSPSTGMFTWVNGISEVYQFPVSPGQSALFMDRESSVIYSKSTDTTGRTGIEIYDLVKREDPILESPVDLSGYVKSEDLEDIINRAVNKALSRKNQNRPFNKQKEGE